MGSVYKDSTRSPTKWTIAWKEGGRWRKKVAYRDKKRSVKLLREIEDRIEAGEVDPLRRHRDRPIREQLDDFLAGLRGKRRTEKYIRTCETRLQSAFEEMGVARIQDLDLGRADGYLAALLDRGRNAKTRDDVAALLKQFGRWAELGVRIRANPFRTLDAKIRKRKDVKRKRRALTQDELAALCQAAVERSAKAYRETHPNAREDTVARYARHGAERSRLYTFAAYTGLRRAECEALEWRDLDLANRKIVRVRPEVAKNDEDQEVPLLPDVVEVLEQHRADRAAQQGRIPSPRDRVFHVARHLLEQVTKDAAWAGLSGEVKKLGDGEHAVERLVDEKGRVLDFHSLRTTTGTLLARAGVPIQLAKDIMRHADVRTTLQHYTQLDLDDLHGAMRLITPNRSAN